MADAKAKPKGTVVQRLMRTGLRKGLMESSTPWLVVGGIAGFLRLAKRLSTPTEKVVYREVLEPGQRLEITHFPEA